MVTIKIKSKITRRTFRRYCGTLQDKVMANNSDRAKLGPRTTGDPPINNAAPLAENPFGTSEAMTDALKKNENAITALPALGF